VHLDIFGYVTENKRPEGGYALLEKFLLEADNA
jgi:hypothetical protein